jgi:hypothetical protein
MMCPIAIRDGIGCTKSVGSQAWANRLASRESRTTWGTGDITCVARWGFYVLATVNTVPACHFAPARHVPMRNSRFACKVLKRGARPRPKRTELRSSKAQNSAARGRGWVARAPRCALLSLEQCTNLLGGPTTTCLAEAIWSYRVARAVALRPTDPDVRDSRIRLFG